MQKNDHSVNIRAERHEVRAEGIEREMASKSELEPNRPMPDIVDVHAHFLPAAYRTALDTAGLSKLDGGMAIPEWSPAAAIEVMDRHGVAMSILSVSSPGLNFVDTGGEAALARAINESAAQLVAAHGTRFGAFGTLPMGDVAASLAEIEHIFDVLKLDGVILETNHRGLYPGDPAFAPILAALNGRKACVFLHPTSPVCLECLSGGRPGPLIEFPFDTTRAVVDLIYSGTRARFPDIRFILSHAGGTIPFLAQRIAGFVRAAPESAGGLTPEAVLAQIAAFHYDTALAANPLQIGALKQIVPTSRILFGSDWPFSPEAGLAGGIAALRAMPILSDEERGLILGENARRMLPRHAH